MNQVTLLFRTLILHLLIKLVTEGIFAALNIIDGTNVLLDDDNHPQIKEHQGKDGSANPNTVMKWLPDEKSVTHERNGELKTVALRRSSEMTRRTIHRTTNTTNILKLVMIFS